MVTFCADSVFPIPDTPSMISASSRIMRGIERWKKNDASSVPRTLQKPSVAACIKTFHVARPKNQPLHDRLGTHTV